MNGPCAVKGCGRGESSWVHFFGHSYRSPSIRQNNPGKRVKTPKPGAKSKH